MFSMIFSLICAWFAFFLPCFATFKSLSQRPVSDPDLERLSMYWAVIAAFVGLEYVAGWFLSWLPFNWEIKTLFLLFLSLPQIQGSTFVYNSYLKPFFVTNQDAIDSGIVSIQGSIISSIQARISAVLELLRSVINKAPPPGQPPSAAPSQQIAGFNIENAMSVFHTYGPALVSALQRGNTNPAPREAAADGTASSTSVATPPSVEHRNSDVLVAGYAADAQ